ncbi:ORF MSV228 leucine rich repeat gene family protein, similar to Amsacta moorei entomopoxvirus Q3 ORF SW:P28854 [Melanoplus sanguinipes entomopoxvirus]|uniref:ORF MSV228 leucine rich repeat gene family protein, similar to Amsacta moorei entomopoxvirus Q3 ORF SW:P28854 n=1 Tax=Melanoplus sanguinipes entomopoxvirus TaxID=83191 RepID=Q9YVL4_MSEPV|nr:ORF MSV228 leucine rich repeat gene family protein, similar to Amsacta moorei entomopoxvirus Q3 ORF SW:P28854 [Melanoplus sanguinipes entomopoxvirus]AAC97711.1 ORF MSV228 leucine rich repeat gene family protein, similar to Amsacta moorei entomopoxvirus Q3 ORF SW:P28854 [Melanoplus sanguinipes entomopoxvirus 'O']
MSVMLEGINIDYKSLMNIESLFIKDLNISTNISKYTNLYKLTNLKFLIFETNEYILDKIKLPKSLISLDIIFNICDEYVNLSFINHFDKLEYLSINSGCIYEIYINEIPKSLKVLKTNITFINKSILYNSNLLSIKFINCDTTSLILPQSTISLEFNNTFTYDYTCLESLINLKELILKKCYIGNLNTVKISNNIEKLNIINISNKPYNNDIIDIVEFIVKLDNIKIFECVMDDNECINCIIKNNHDRCNHNILLYILALLNGNNILSTNEKNKKIYLI